MAVRIGKPVPDVETEAWVRGAHGPKKVALSQYRGKWIVLFFYPRDFTFICPTEIAAFAAKQPDFEREDAVVISASTDSFHEPSTARAPIAFTRTKPGSSPTRGWQGSSTLSSLTPPTKFVEPSMCS